MKYKTAFRLALRLIGLLLISLSLPALIGAMVPFFTNAWMEGASGSNLLEYLAMEDSVTRALQCALGFYFLFGGRWIINRIIPSNRPYCHECGYEQTGLPAEGRCPECGTAYRRTEHETRVR